MRKEGNAGAVIGAGVLEMVWFRVIRKYYIHEGNCQRVKSISYNCFSNYAAFFYFF